MSSYNLICGENEMRRLKNVWMRLNVIVGYLPLLLCDILVAWFGMNSWLDLRRESDKALYKIWLRYAYKEGK